MRLPFRLIPLLLAAAPIAAAAAAPRLQPGDYEVSLQLAIPRTTAQLPVRQVRVCFTPRDIVFGNAYAVTETGQLCTVSQLQEVGNAVRYHFVCATPGGVRMVGTAQGSRHPAGYAITMGGHYVPATPGMNDFTQTLRARWVGDCPPHAAE